MNGVAPSRHAAFDCLPKHDSAALCRAPRKAENNGTFSITSVGGVGSTFVLEWFKRVERARQRRFDCVHDPSARDCGCALLDEGDSLPHLVSCHVDDDGAFKHLGDPRALNRFGSSHRAVLIVGSPTEAVASVFRRRFQCWHFYRLQSCWFTRSQRDGIIPCSEPGVAAFRARFGEEASRCRVPRAGPLASLAAFASQGEDLFGASEQFRSWLSCRAPACTFDLLVLRYETLGEALPALFNFLRVPPSLRPLFPHVRPSRPSARPNGSAPAGLPPADGEREALRGIYGPLEAAVEQIPPEGLLLVNRAAR